MRELLKNWKVMLVFVLLFISALLISINGLKMGVDFSGGTLFQIHLAGTVEDPSQLATVRSIVEQRMDSFGLRDTTVTTWGKEFVIAQIAETDPEAIANLETLLRTQGKFEATIDGNVLFEGSDILQIVKDPGKGYGFIEEEGGIRWNLPFVLKQSAARNFSHMVFHRCTATGIDSKGASQYDCDLTYFFIDRPRESLLIIPGKVYAADTELLLNGSQQEDISQGTQIEELLLNAAMPYFVVDENLSEEQTAQISALVQSHRTALLPPATPQGVKDKLAALGFKLKEISAPESVPWTWLATGAQQTIALTSGITGWDPYIATVDEQKIFSELFITGAASDIETAKTHLQSLTILLETGSLPVAIDNISKETISPLLGKEFLNNVMVMGVAALIVVSLIIFLRYKKLTLTIPIVITSISEAVLTLGVAALIGFNLDLAAVAGIIAAIGTGVNDQIIITDELMQSREATSGSLLNRVKRAFFIVMAAASTVIATMLPIIIFGFGFGKLVGFAVTTIICVLVGVLITRPAYGEVARYLLSKY
ncbi:MAG: hypothetical protein V1676_02780 [Candidatus Diapherotrites archaeon]